MKKKGIEMNTQKQWWQSKTMWAGIVTLVIGALGTLGLDNFEGQNAAIVEKIMQIVTGLGGIMTIIGRATARTEITPIKKKTAVVLLCLAIIIMAGGCVRSIYMEPEVTLQFNRFNASVQDWDRRCQADPNTCAESLATMAKELNVWTNFVNGMDPNSI